MSVPNLCDYTLKAVGKRENLEKLISWLNNDYHYINGEKNWDGTTLEEIGKNYKFRFDSRDGTKHLFTNDDRHFYRVFDCYVDENSYDEEDGSVVAFGDCAWSVSSCMFDSPWSYYQDGKTDEFAELKKDHSITIPLAAKELGLKVEIFSAEPGMCFSEHVLCDCGEMVAEEDFDYQEYYLADYKTKEETEKDLNIKITDDEWTNEDYVSRCVINPYHPVWSI